MSDHLAFDAETGARLERLYLSSDVKRRREMASDALRPQEGQHILDVGCGPGFHAAELAELVGSSGRVTGIDMSEAMLSVAQHRNASRANVSFHLGDATSLPVPDDSADGMVTVQVFEYVPDVRSALREAKRVLRPGGRLVVVDVDWSTLSWHSNHPERMSSVLSLWDEHLAHPSLPRRLASEMTSAGFTEITVEGEAFVNTDAGPNGYSGGVIPLIADFVTDHGIEASVADAWAAELRGLSKSGDYYFTVTTFAFSGMNPH